MAEVAVAAVVRVVLGPYTVGEAAAKAVGTTVAEVVVVVTVEAAAAAKEAVVVVARVRAKEENNSAKEDLAFRSAAVLTRLQPKSSHASARPAASARGCAAATHAAASDRCLQALSGRAISLPRS